MQLIDKRPEHRYSGHRIAECADAPRPGQGRGPHIHAGLIQSAVLLSVRTDFPRNALMASEYERFQGQDDRLKAEDQSMNERNRVHEV